MGGPRITDSKRRSWSRFFAERVRHRRYVNWFIVHGDPHNARAWAIAFGRPDLAPPPTTNAPWLSGEAIAYRKAIGRTEPFL